MGVVPSQLAIDNTWSGFRTWGDDSRIPQVPGDIVIGFGTSLAEDLHEMYQSDQNQSEEASKTRATKTLPPEFAKRYLDVSDEVKDDVQTAKKRAIPSEEQRAGLGIST